MGRVGNCTDYDLHEQLLGCAHRGGTQVEVRLGDGCSGRLCQGCFTGLGVKQWPGYDADASVAGPEAGLDALQMIRALRGRRV